MADIPLNNLGKTAPAMTRLAVAAGYAAAAAYPMVVWAEWEALTREDLREQAQSANRYFSADDRSYSRSTLVFFALVLAAWIFARTRSCETGARVVRGIDAGVMTILALTGVSLIWQGNAFASGAGLYDVLGVFGLILTILPGRYRLGPFTTKISSD